MTNLLNDLRNPFSPSAVSWKPGAVNRDQTKALALAYADLRAYQERLDEVCGMSWSVSYTPWGDRIVCHLTINGVTRSSTGEADSQSERSEVAGTAAEAQAFKRAASMFGLGRYLYSLPSVWVEYDKESRRFTDKGQAKLQGIIQSQYSQAVGKPAAPEQKQEEQQQEGDGAVSLRQEFDRLGQRLYGDQWPQVSRHNVERITGGQTSDPGQLSIEQVSRLIDGLKSLQRNRTTKATKQAA